MTTSSIRQPGDVVNEVYSENIPLIIQLCEDAGDDPTPLVEQIKYELQKMVAEMMAEDDSLLERKRAELVPIRAKYESLFHELYPDKTCPQYGNTLAILPALRRYVDEHKKLKEEHEKLLISEADIRREERQLANELNQPSLQVDNSNLQSKPFVSQISLLSEHIQQLREEKSKRVSRLMDIVRTLNEYEEVYGWKRPTNDTMIGRLLNQSLIEIDQFSLTKESIELVEKEFIEIKEQIQKVEAEFEESHQKLTKLIRKHQSLIPNEKALAATTTKRCRISKLPDLVAEVDRYNDHAMEKLTNDILKSRERIHLILNKLSVGDVTNDSKYAILNTSQFTDDLLFMHEELAQELEAQYEMNRSMYEKLESWNELFQEYQEFEKNASDPQRFHRRGYSALAEEKTRKKLEATLRDCERELLILAEEFQIKNNGQPFRMNSNDKEISDYINQRKDDYIKTKEREREAAKAAHSTTNATSGTMVGRTPLKNKQIFGSTSSIASKRVAAGTNTTMRTPSKNKQTFGSTSTIASKRGDINSTLRTPLANSRRAAASHLATGKTPK